MKKQVVIIMTDTQRWDMLNCNRDTGLKTPCLDKIAANGMNFKHSYTAQPVCGPARSAIFTGTYPHTNGVWANSMPLGDNIKTIGQRLSDKGVKTAYVGKWHLDGGDYFGMGRCPDGWDSEYWFDMRNYLEGMSREDRVKSRDMKLMEKESVKREFTFGHQVTERAMDFIERYKDEDFLLVVSYDEPHHPFICPNEYYDMYEDYEFPQDMALNDTLVEKSPHYKVWSGGLIDKSTNELPIDPREYFACNTFVDSLIGEVYESMKMHTPDALGIYTSDHGDALYSHRITNKGPSSYDCVARIPFLAWCSGKIEKSSEYQHPTSHIDIVPTVMDYMGFKKAKTLKGKSMLPAFYKGEKINDEVFIEYGRYEVDHDGFGGFQPMRAVFDGRFKLTVFLQGTDELYDMHNDPDEMNNLIESVEYTEIRDRLHDSLLDRMNETRDPFRGYHWEKRPWRKDAGKPTWDYTLMTRQREEDDYEPRQLDYLTGLEITDATRKKG